MGRPLCGLLGAILMAALIAVNLEGTQGLAQKVDPGLPSDTIVARVAYDRISDLLRLAEYDVWEYNNLEQRYVLVALSAAEYQSLEADGWRLEIDAAATANIQDGTSRPFNDGYRTVDDIFALLEDLNQQHLQLSELMVYGDGYCHQQGGCITLGGDSFPGYPLLAMRLTNEAVAGTSIIQGQNVTRGEKPVFLLLANIHAREITTAEIALRLVTYLLENYGQNADVTWLLDWHEIWIIPTANPEGHWLVELGSAPVYGGAPFYQRKNLNNESDGDLLPDCTQWPPSGGWQYGVDLNRNHSFAWGPPGSSDEPCSQTFRGPQMASEPETAALQQLVRNLVPDQRGPAPEDSAPLDTTGILLSLHSFSELILRPWAHSSAPAPNEVRLKAIGDKMATFNGYSSCPSGSCLYDANGTTDDWAYGELGIPAFTFEIGREFMPPYQIIDAVQWPENKPAFIYAAKIARSPYQTVMGPDVTNVEVTPHSGNNAIQVSAAIDESDHGGQIIQDAVYAVDTPFWSAGTLPHPATAADGTFDSNAEEVTISIDPNSLSAGKHIVFIRGQDSSGNWGVTSAAFIHVQPAWHSRLPLILYYN